MAVRRRTTLKSLVENALRREIGGLGEPRDGEETRYSRNELGFLTLKRSPSERISLVAIQTLEESMNREELQEAVHPGGKS